MMVWAWCWRRLAPAAGVVVVVLGAVASGAWAAVPVTVSFTSAGVHSFVVPAGISSISVKAVGAAGGAAGCGSGAGGMGASLTATVKVSPGEHLSVGVGSPGASGPSCGSTAGAAGGVGGGGAGGSSNYATGAAGGGGASSVGPSGSGSPLVVAGGGGGGGGYGAAQSPFGAGGAGGNAGSAGATSYPCGGCVLMGGGGAGTAIAGGSGGGGDCVGCDGAVGSFGVAGGGGANGGGGGGGGGGGYYGGGGGGAAAESGPGGGGGGGGSSFTAPGATNVTGPTSTSNPAEVVINYRRAPTAAESTRLITFGTQPVGLAGVARMLTVTNHGSAPLIVSGVLLGGAKPDDYLIGDRCLRPVAVGASCQIGVRFDPQTKGKSSATLTLLTNASVAPRPVALSGTGG